ncbi:MAG: hypothetical protein ACU0DW_12870 [Shimia sp.]
MSAPDTNLEKQEKRHWGSLLGIKAVLVYAAILLAIFVIYVTAMGNDPTDDATQSSGGAAAVETSD